MVNRFIYGAFLAALLVLPQGATRGERPVSYALEIVPILSDKCFACHGPDAAARQADLRLDERQGALADLGGYAAIVPGDPDGSHAVKRILSDDESEQMPPPEAHKELTSEEVELLKRWISEGANYEPHWSFRPLSRPPLPESDTSGETVHPIDRFVSWRLREAGLEASPPADQVTLVRRLYLDLVGLPPTEAELDAFLADTSPKAWERLVDRLLDDPRHAERMAVMWLDLVRYADTIGYHSDNFMEVSAYRDYVIEAFRRNLPFDQFTVEQLAGDLLPNPTVEQRVATGYNMLLQTTEEGGAQPKEYVAIYAADRVRSVSGVWLGTTLGCAQCHDHKFDPFTLRDFTTMAAFFADIAELPVGPRTPNIKLPTPEEQLKIDQLKARIESLREENLFKADPQLSDRVAAEQKAWEQQTCDELAAGVHPWIAPEPVSFAANDGIQLRQLADNSLLTSGPNPYAANYDVELTVSGTLTGLRLEVITDPSFRRFGWLARHNGNFVLTEVKVEFNGQSVELAAAQADFEQPGFPIGHVIDGNAKTGWAVDGGGRLENRIAQVKFATPLEIGTDPKTLRVRLEHQSIYSQHHIGRFKLAVTSQAEAPLDAPAALPAQVVAALTVPEADRTDAERKSLASYYRTISPVLEQARNESRELQQRLAKLEASLRTSLTVQALETPRVTRILPRGNWLDETGEIVQPAVPEFLPPALPSDRRLNRLDLARWIVDEENPLTARVFVNRMWKVFHGRGLSRNLDDLGGQGEPPSHPLLLDWLAVEFQESGWDIRHMTRMIVTSDTYRQSSSPSAELLAKDPTNRWFARQGRWRLEAEFVRDSALQLAGLLDVSRVGGKSVKPYQPAGYWQHLNFPAREWENSKGQDLYRRSLYTFWCRTFLHPSMLAFDAPSREECTAMRSQSNIPQQALVLLNDPIFVEAARGFAARIVSCEGSPEERVAWAMRQATARDATQDELALLVALYSQQHERYSASPKEARQLIEVGESPVIDTVDPAELAAWTQVARAILGAYETTSRF